MKTHKETATVISAPFFLVAEKHLAPVDFIFSTASSQVTEIVDVSASKLCRSD